VGREGSRGKVSKVCSRHRDDVKVEDKVRKDNMDRLLRDECAGLVHLRRLGVVVHMPKEEDSEREEGELWTLCFSAVFVYSDHTCGEAEEAYDSQGEARNREDMERNEVAQEQQ